MRKLELDNGNPEEFGFSASGIRAEINALNKEIDLLEKGALSDEEKVEMSYLKAELQRREKELERLTQPQLERGS